MLHVKVTDFGDVKLFSPVRGLPGCIATRNLAVECCGFTVVFRDENEHICFESSLASSTAVEYETLKEAVEAARAPFDKVAQAITCLQPRLRDLCEVEEDAIPVSQPRSLPEAAPAAVAVASAASPAPPASSPAKAATSRAAAPSPSVVASPTAATAITATATASANPAASDAAREREGLYRVGVRGGVVVVHEWGRVKERFRMGSEGFLFPGMLLRKSIRDCDCYVRVGGPSAFAVWPASQGMKGEPQIMAPTFSEAASWLKGERKTLGAVLRNIVKKLRAEVVSLSSSHVEEPKEHPAAAGAAAAASVSTGALADDEAAFGDGEGDDDEDFELEESAGPVASVQPAATRVLLHDAPSSIDVMNWGAPMFRIETRSREPFFFRVGMVMAQTLGRMRLVVTCDKAEVVDGKPHQLFRAWKYGAPESVVAYPTLTRACVVWSGCDMLFLCLA